MRKSLLLLSEIAQIALMALTIAFVGSLAIPSVHADEFDKKTVLTFSEAVQVPGKVLPAGTYVFKLSDSQDDRNIVQIFNADDTRLITTVMAIPNYRRNAADQTIVTFEERLAGQPEAIQSWFYPGDNYGQEFVYPQQRVKDLAQIPTTK